MAGGLGGRLEGTGLDGPVGLFKDGLELPVGGQAGPGPDMGGANFGGQAGGSGAGPDVVDADYEVVDDDKK